MIISLSMLQCIQLNNHLSTKYRTNYKAKFNFIDIKKTKDVSIFYLKGRKIKILIIIYIEERKKKKKNQVPGLKEVPSLVISYLGAFQNTRESSMSPIGKSFNLV